MQPFADPADGNMTRLAIIPSHILPNERRFEVKLRRQVERQAALRGVALAFGWIKADLHLNRIYDMGCPRKVVPCGSQSTAFLPSRGRFWQPRLMWRTILLYALALALAAAALEWLEYRYLVRAFSTELYVLLLAIGFVALGVWAGVKLTPRPRAAAFVRNDAVARSLGISPRELEIIEALATGESVKELARRFGISPNTVKTHVARVYEKLAVQKRVQAIEKARFLALIP